MWVCTVIYIQNSSKIEFLILNPTLLITVISEGYGNLHQGGICVHTIAFKLTTIYLRTCIKLSNSDGNGVYSLRLNKLYTSPHIRVVSMA